MSDLLGSFFNGAMVGKLNRNNREMNEMGCTIADAVVEHVTAHQTIEELQEKVHIY